MPVKALLFIASAATASWASDSAVSSAESSAKLTFRLKPAGGLISAAGSQESPTHRPRAAPWPSAAVKNFTMSSPEYFSPPCAPAGSAASITDAMRKDFADITCLRNLRVDERGLWRNGYVES